MRSLLSALILSGLIVGTSAQNEDVSVAAAARAARAGGRLSHEIPVATSHSEALFYSVPGTASLNSFRDNAARVSLIAPQVFSLDRRGHLKGTLPPELWAVARERHVPVMPVVINAGFSRLGAHYMLRSPAARDRAVGNLVEAARSMNLVGWQIDFEGMLASDRPYLSRFVAEASRSLHHADKMLSVAVAARIHDTPNENFHTYSGVYDYKALSQSADFLSVMAYPEHDRHTGAGPLASYPWVQQVIEHVLESVPASKLSLGMPSYETDWGQHRVKERFARRVGHHIRHFFRWVFKAFTRNHSSDHGDTELKWDPVLRSSYRVAGEGIHRHVTWIEDERSFEAELELVRQYHLRGFSVWRIGLEDPHIWAYLPEIQQAKAHHTESSAASPSR